MKFFASRGLIGDVSDVWPLDGRAPTRSRPPRPREDGKQYFVPCPTTRGRSSTASRCGSRRATKEPKTLDELTALSQKMQKDGLTPIAFADKDGWPAMGTFDALNLRINGYQYHIDLMQGKNDWSSPEVRRVFDTWKSLLPFHQSDALGRTWQEAAQSLQQKKSGMYLLGTFVNEQFPADRARRPRLLHVPRDRPGHRVRRDRRPDRRPLHVGQPEEPGRRPRRSSSTSPRRTPSRPRSTGRSSARSRPTRTPTPPPTARCRRSRRSSSARPRTSSQFLDRDTRPDFASTVVIPAFQQLHQEPGRRRRASSRAWRSRRSPSSSDRAPTRKVVMTLTGPKPAARVKRTAEGTPDAPRDGCAGCSRTDRVVVTLMVAIPTLFVLRARLVLPALASVAAELHPLGGHRGRWTRSSGSASTNYKNIFTIYPPFYPALRHNLIWLVVPVPGGRRCSASSSRCCSTRRCAAAGSTRPRSTSRWCSRWPSPASSGS